MAKDLFEGYATCPFKLTMLARKVEASPDRKSWQGLPSSQVEGKAQWHIGEELIAAGRCRFFLRLTR